MMDTLPTRPLPTASEPRIAAVLFADVVGFSKLTDRQVEHFVREFLTAVAALARSTANAPSYSNTWGDGLYFQFADVRTAGLFALELVEMVTGTDWTKHQLPSALTLRAGLHAGPLFAFRDPVTGQNVLWGRHVTRAARIEPITPPGEVYSSREFAALASAYGIRDFDCEPVGRVSLAKAYGDVRLFHVRRRVAAAYATTSGTTSTDPSAGSARRA
jgi:class 3 adenylate cyclase